MITFIILGFIAEIIDGCLGMAYGVFLTSLLISNGSSLIMASSSIHFSEIFTTLASGISHIKQKNVDFNMLKKLAVSGVIGGITGAYILTSIDGEMIKPFVSVYLLILGFRILLKAKDNFKKKDNSKHLIPLGSVGGFFDAIGGGGWGPIVTSSLIEQGNVPCKAIGTVNTAEFFVTFAQSVTFFTVVGIKAPQMTLGLIIGGIVAAPLSAYLCKKINQKVLRILVALVIIGINCYALYHLWGKL